MSSSIDLLKSGPKHGDMIWICRGNYVVHSFVLRQMIPYNTTLTQSLEFVILAFGLRDTGCL